MSTPAAAPTVTPVANTGSTPPTKPLDGWVEVFRAGTHTDSKGRTCTFTQADVDQMIANHALGAAPAVIGHPTHDAPAYGWVADYKRDGDNLYAKFEKLNPAFVKGVEDGAYINRSLSVVKDKTAGWRVNHVGWLGAAPPAIDGLAPLYHAAPDADIFEFAAPGQQLAWSLENLAQGLRGLRDYLIEKEGLEGADRVLPQWRIDSALQAAAEARAEPNTPTLFTAPAQVQKGTVTVPQTATPPDADVLAAAQQAAQAAQEQLAEFTRASAAKDAELAALRKERQTERLTAQVETLVKQGRISPAQRAGMVEFMASIEDAGTAEFTFSRADAEVKKTPVQYFAEFVAALPVQVQLGKPVAGAEAGGADATNDSAAIANQAREYMAAQAAKGIVVELHHAIAHVTRPAA